MSATDSYLCVGGFLAFVFALCAVVVALGAYFESRN
jgi:hypothetical protein